MQLQRHGWDIHIVSTHRPGGRRSCRGSVPENGATGRARAGLVIPARRRGAGTQPRHRLRSRRLRFCRGLFRFRCDGFRFWRGPHGPGRDGSRLRRCRSGPGRGGFPPRRSPFRLRYSRFGLRRSPFWLRYSHSGLRRRPFWLWRSPFWLRRSPFWLRYSRSGLRCTPRGLRFGGRGPRRRARAAGLSHRALAVVPQGRLDDLQAPLGLGPPGELGPRQHLVQLRGVGLGELEPDGDRFRLGLPGTCHGFKVPTTGVLTEVRHDCPK